jgi:DNA-binding transcriptional MerR regulator
MNSDIDTGPADRELAAVEVVELHVLARQAGVKLVHVRHYLRFGLFEPHPAATAEPPRFAPRNAARVARAERLRRDLGLNYAGAVLACELLDRISELEARLAMPQRAPAGLPRPPRD